MKNEGKNSLVNTLQEISNHMFITKVRDVRTILVSGFVSLPHWCKLNTRNGT